MPGPGSTGVESVYTKLKVLPSSGGRCLLFASSQWRSLTVTLYSTQVTVLGPVDPLMSAPLLDSPPGPPLPSPPEVTCVITCWAVQPSPFWTPCSTLLFFPFLYHTTSWAILLKCASNYIIPLGKFSSLTSLQVNHPFMMWSLSKVKPQY